MKGNLNDKLEKVEIWSEETGWEEYDCPEDVTVGEYAEWCIGEDSPVWATVNCADDGIRLNGWYVIDGADYFDACGNRIDTDDSTAPRKISLNNGVTFLTADEAMPQIQELDMWEAVAHYMDDDTREAVHRELSPCSELEFLRRYLELAPDDLIIG